MQLNDEQLKNLRDLLMGAVTQIITSHPNVADRIQEIEQQWFPNDPERWMGDREATCKELDDIIGELGQDKARLYGAASLYDPNKAPKSGQERRLLPSVITAIEKLREAHVLLTCGGMELTIAR